MSDKKVIAVVGATGAQGGGLVESILSDDDGPFVPRVLTRNPDSDAARALADRGAQVAQVDINDVDSVKDAFEGAHGAFCVTFFWEHFSPEKEKAQAQNMAQAAAMQGLNHVIWSTLEDTRKWVPLDDDRMPTLQEHYKVPHFDAKGEANQYFEDAGVPTTFLLTSFYWDNLIHFGMGPRRDEDGSLTFALPMGDAKLPGIAASDIGGCAYGIFKEGGRHVGDTIGIAGGHLKGQEMAVALGDAFGEEVTYQAVPFDVYRDLDFPGADDLGNMFQFKHDFEEYFCGARSLEVSRRLNPDLQTFEEWLAANKERIEIQ